MAVCGFLLETLVTSGGYGNKKDTCIGVAKYQVRTPRPREGTANRGNYDAIFKIGLDI